MLGRKVAALLVTLSVAVMAYNIYSTAPTFANKSIVICNSNVLVVSNSKLPSILSTLSTTCVPKVIHFYALHVLLPSKKDIQEAMPAHVTTEYGDSSHEIAWQLDYDHMNVTYAWKVGSKLPGGAVGVAVIDTGIAQNLPQPMSEAVDYQDGVALTTLVDYLISWGMCNDSGIVTFTNKTVVEVVLSPYLTVNYTLPSTVPFEYCLIADSDSNTTYVLLQATVLSD